MKIAITTRTDLLEDKNRIFVNEAYIKKILAFSHTPIPIYGGGNEAAIAEFCDALIVPGGYDIAPFYFHEAYDEHAYLYDDPTMDLRDFRILQAFVEKRKPILGICRGIQLINVFFDGTLNQHINLEKHEKEHTHTIQLTPDSFITRCMKNDDIVNSYHHQAIDKLGKQLHVCAKSQDGCIEAIEHASLPIIAVQWHPESMDHDAIFPYFFHML